jgi:hypothetical protein
MTMHEQIDRGTKAASGAKTQTQIVKWADGKMAGMGFYKEQNGQTKDPYVHLGRKSFEKRCNHIAKIQNLILLVLKK